MDAVAEATSAQELEATLLKKALLEALKARQQSRRLGFLQQWNYFEIENALTIQNLIPGVV